MNLIPYALTAVLFASGGKPDPALQPYQPRPVEHPNGPYVLTDGSIYIVGSAEMQPILEKFNELFTNAHPGFKFKMLLKSSSTGLPGITAGVSAFAPISRQALPLELRPFRQMYGHLPTDIHIGWNGYTATNRIRPPGLYINVRNPLSGLSAAKAARIFVVGAGKGDLTHWGQLGLTAGWANRAIHVYGPRDDGSFATGMRHSKMNGLPFTPRYEPLPDFWDLIQAVAQDPYGIALIGSLDSKRLPPEVKILPLANEEGGRYSIGSYDDVLEGRYPYAQYLHLYMNRAPGQPLEPFLQEYAKLALSREGQAIIANRKNTPAA